MIRIIIEIDGENVHVRTDHQRSEAENANLVDAGSAPVELLNEHEPEWQQSERGSGKRGKDVLLNPLRQGQAIARRLYPRAEGHGETGEAIDAGGPPKLPNAGQKEKPSKQRPRKR